MIREISRKYPPDTRKIEVRNDTGITIHAKCVVTAQGNIYMELYKYKRTGTKMVMDNLYEVLPIEDVDF